MNSQGIAVLSGVIDRPKTFWTIALSGLFALLIASGVQPVHALVLGMAVTAQTTTGAIWWLLMVKGRSPTVETLGVGVALGTVGTVLSAQLSRYIGLGSWGWSAPVILTVILLLSGRVRKRLRVSYADREMLDPRGRLVLFGALLLGLPTVLIFWLQHPLHWDGYLNYSVDIAFHEALAHSVHSFGPNESIFVTGENIRYHWLSHAWVGAMSDWTEPGPFVVLTRIVPLVSLLGTVTVGWAWARRLSDRWWVPPVASALLSGGSYVGFADALGDHMVGGRSPTQSLTTAWLLTFALVLTLALSSSLRPLTSLTVTTVLGFALIGGKVSHAAVLAGGMVALFAFAAIPKGTNRTLIFAHCLSSGLGVAVGYFFLIAGGDGNGLKLGFDRTAAGAAGLEPGPHGPIGTVLGSLALVAAILPRWSGLVGLRAPQEPSERNPLFIFGAGVLATSMLLLLFTTQPGVSQLYFALSGSVLLTVLSVVGLGAIAAERPLRKSDSPGWAFAFFVIVTGTLAAAAGFTLRFADILEGRLGLRTGNALAWLAPFAVWFVILAIILARPRIKRLEVFAHYPKRVVVISALFAASIASLLASHSWSIANEVRGRDSSPDTGWHPEHVEAAEWLRANSATRDVVITNRLCSNATEMAPECPSRWFLISAVAGRRMWIEGYDYGIGIGDLPSWALQRIEDSQRLAGKVSKSDINRLIDQGGSWVWLDCQIECTWEHQDLGTEVFHNDHVSLVELKVSDS